jgi:hypothetical protein
LKKQRVFLDLIKCAAIAPNVPPGLIHTDGTTLTTQSTHAFMILACGPSGPGLLLLLAVIFGLPVISGITSIVGILAKRPGTAWIGASMGFLTALPGMICLGNAMSHGNSSDAMMLLLGGGPMALASIALIRAVCIQKAPDTSEFR